MRDSSTLRTRCQLRSLRLLCCLAAALASSSSAASGGVLAWPFGSAPAQEQEPPEQQGPPEQQARLDAWAAWAQLPAAMKDSISNRLVALDNAHRLALLETVPSLRALSQEQKQMLLDELSPVAAPEPRQSGTDERVDQPRRRGAASRNRNAVMP